MENRIKFLIKNTSILTISSFSSKVLVFFLVPLYTNILSTEEYGVYELIMSVIQLCIPIFTLNIVDGVLRFSMDKTEDRNQVKSIGFYYIVVSIFAFTVVLIINYLYSIWTVTRGFEIYIWLYFVFFVFNQLLIHVAKGQEQVKELGVAGVISTIASIVGNIMFLVILPLRIRGFFLAYIMGQVLSAMYLCLKTKFIKGLSFNTNIDLKKRMYAYSFPLILGTLGWLINNMSDRFVVSWMCGLADNGIYSVAYKIPTIITTIQNIFLQAWTISAIKEYKQDDYLNFYRKMFSCLNAIMVLSCSILIILTKNIAHVLYVKDFYAAWQYVPFLLISVVFGAAAGFIGPILSAKMNSKAIATSTVFGAIINLVLNMILILAIGPQGAAIATAASSFAIYIIRKKSLGNLLSDNRYLVIMSSWLMLVIQATLMITDNSILWQIPIIIANICFYRFEFIAIIKKSKDILFK